MNFTELQHKIEASLTEKMPFLVYRKSNEKSVKAVFQKNNFLQKTDDFTQKGFIFSPFLLENDAILFDFENSNVFEVDFSKTENSAKNVDDETSNSGKENHIALVNKTIDFIKSGQAEKVVISRKEEVQLHDFSVSKTFEKLLNTYPTAMVYVWYHSKVGLWMGATPETLVSIQNNEFKTMALAGTQPFKGTKDVTWQQKEMDEQQYVTDYISNNLKGKIANVEVSKPYTVKAGNLLHLRTDIRGSLNNSNEIQSLIESLHPTPAVCGFSKQKAQDFIVENEHYNREFYTGFLGELNVANETNLFVNLRCMQVNGDKASLYIGGGITKDSTAENEWQETVAKSRVMKKVLK